MSDAHQYQREALGAYVLGALDPAERHAVEAHLGDCATCRDELSRLSALPPLLGRLSPDEAADSRLLPSRDLASRVARAAAIELGRLRRQLRVWRSATAVAAAAALLVVVGADLLGTGGPDLAPPIVAGVVPVAADAMGTEGSASAYAWEWGTTVELEVADLPTRDRYLLYTVGADGRREQAGTWGPTAARSARLRSASSIDRDLLRRVEVTDADGTVLFAFDFDA